ncbi:MAG: kinase/pyrophosphorylase, partial [Cycloclasticus sp.]
MKNRTIFFISDRTAITSETLGNSLLTQFEGVERERHVIPFIDTESRAKAVKKKINDSYTVNEGR